VVEISKFKDAGFWAGFWGAKEGGTTRNGGQVGLLSTKI
jgi:hypothetical protein